MTQHEAEIEIKILDGDDAYYPRLIVTFWYHPPCAATRYEPAYGAEIEFDDARVVFDSGVKSLDAEKLALDYIASDSGRQYLIDIVEGYRI